MSRQSLALAAMAVALWTQSCNAQESTGRESEKIEAPSGNVAPAGDVDPDRVAATIIDRTNQFRLGEDLQAVSPNEKLMKAASYFAGYMAQHDEYGHGADGKRPSERADRFGYEYCLVSENIAYQYSSRGFQQQELAKRFVEGWKESPGHRRNMLESAARETGVAVARSEKTGHWYAVQMFGRPRSASIEVQIANRSSIDIEYRVGDRAFSLPARYSRTHELCRPAKLTVQLPNENRALELKSSANYVIEGQPDSITIREREA